MRPLVLRIVIRLQDLELLSGSVCTSAEAMHMTASTYQTGKKGGREGLVKRPGRGCLAILSFLQSWAKLNRGST